jgi:acyl-CoA thioester hydrolase
MKELIIDYPVSIEIPITWGDMDAFKHVNNVVYFKYFENVRVSYLEKLEFLSFMDKTGIGPILASTQCSYKIPLAYPDNVTVAAKVETIEDERFIMKYAVVSHNHKKIAALGECVIVIFDYHKNKKTFIPEEIRNRILTLEKSVIQEFSE